jgi:WhiB family redox-sensing transcriptional regulator
MRRNRELDSEVFGYLRVLQDDPDLWPETGGVLAPAEEASGPRRTCGRCGVELGDDVHRLSRYCSDTCRRPLSGPVYETPVDLDTAWMDQANCLGCDPELFFPARGESCVEAKAVCQACVVRVECLNYALETGETLGIWGGRSERERRRLRRERTRFRGRRASA